MGSSTIYRHKRQWLKSRGLDRRLRVARRVVVVVSRPAGLVEPPRILFEHDVVEELGACFLAELRAHV